MKKSVLLILGTFCTSLALADNLPSGSYVGKLSEAVSGSWSWDTNAITGDVDATSNAKINIPKNPHLFGLTATLTATVDVDGTVCSTKNAKVHIGIFHTPVTFSNCVWTADTNTLTTNFKTAPLFGMVIGGVASIHK